MGEEERREKRRWDRTRGKESGGEGKKSPSSEISAVEEYVLEGM